MIVTLQTQAIQTIERVRAFVAGTTTRELCQRAA